ncbi:MAG: tyrosine-protein phosphatase [Syntrophomonadaceae bacterium]
MIDLHTHILPGLDDGAADLEEALAMAQVAAQEGITSVVATPHIVTGLYNHNRLSILAAVQQLNEEITQRKIGVKVLPGAEVHLEADIAERLARGELLCINDNNKYLLLELPTAFVPGYTETLIYKIQLQGIVPIIAHPERNTGILSNLSLLKKLVARGTLTQITAGSITGRFGLDACKTAFYLLEEGMGHLIASDAHSAQRRKPGINDAYQVVEKKLGKELAQTTAIVNPAKIIRGEPVDLPRLEKAKKTWKTAFNAILSNFKL